MNKVVSIDYSPANWKLSGSKSGECYLTVQYWGQDPMTKTIRTFGEEFEFTTTKEAVLKIEEIFGPADTEEKK